MKQEDKQLLLTDLCARLQYDVKVSYEGQVKEIQYIEPRYNELKLLDDSNYTIGIEEIKPYLRPMSSMTDEEIIDFLSIPDLSMVSERFINDIKSGSFSIMVHMSNYARNIDWLNKNMFDYRGLIPKGLAIEVDEDNNPYI